MQGILAEHDMLCRIFPYNHILEGDAQSTAQGVLIAIGCSEETAEAPPLSDFLEVNVLTAGALLCCRLLCLVTDIILFVLSQGKVNPDAPLLRLYIRTGDYQA